jgi:signal transduction histidine kinase
MPLRLALLPACLALGAVSLLIAREAPAFSFAGTALPGALALLAAGWALLAVGFAHWRRRQRNAVGPLLAAASVAWFIGEWDNPAVGRADVFVLGLILYAACAPLVGWAMLAYPSGRLTSWAERVVVSVAMAGSLLVLGLLPTLFFDPVARGCLQCPENPLLLLDEPALYDDLNQVGVQLGLMWSLLLIAVAGWGLARSTETRRRVVAPVVAAGCTYLSLVAAMYGASLDRGFVGSGGLERLLWLGQAAALVALAAAVAWGLLRVHRARSSLARLVVELGESAPMGRLREALAGALADPLLDVAYPVGEGRFADAAARPVDLGQVQGRAATPLLRDGRTVAVLVHRAGLLDNPELVVEVASAARLALENERLQAEARTQLEDLRCSRARIIEEGDAERRRLERDLHDGAQQRLVGLSLGLGLLRALPGADQDRHLAGLLHEAEAELGRAIADLRELAHGIHPTALTDEGLAAAVEALAERASEPVRIAALPQERFSPAVETAAYLVVAEAAKAGSVHVGARRQGGSLRVDVEAQREPETLIDLADRVRAQGGSLDVVQAPGGEVRIRVEIPCE